MPKVINCCVVVFKVLSFKGQAQTNKKKCMPKVLLSVLHSFPSNSRYSGCIRFQKYTSKCYHS